MNRGACDICAGKGRVPQDGGRYLGKCLPCGGTGKKRWKTLTCPSCQGAGYNQGACIDCAGTGELIDESA